MTNNSNDKINQMQTLIEGLINANVAAVARMDRLEEARRDCQKSNERLTRIEQIVESNNRFLESFSISVRQFSDTVNNLAQRQNAMISTSNEDRREANIKLGRIQQKVDAIALHLGLND